ATVSGPKLRVAGRMRAAITGADLSPQVNGKRVGTWRPLDLADGDTISFGFARSGCRAYFAISGGIDFPIVMGSRSVHTRSNLGGEGRALKKGDILKIGDARLSDGSFSEIPAMEIPCYGREWTIRVVMGPQNDYFTRRGIETFLNSEYVISTEADRMGYRLKGPKIEHKAGPDILTDATPPGSIQVPGDGMPIVLLADGQTTGGYSKIAGVASVDQDLLAQARPGDKVRFEKITVVEAHRLLSEQEKRIEQIRNAVGAIRHSPR
ncbi:MAG TPA: biotin-dependent carboxyltransferase family protein, partial [Thermodesulfobacteriota bacterium]|nr:biotin-dependent carboxyltransferase family protein [Thermodesulfobacteriota bacterium]